MSAINIFVTPESAYVFSDGAFFDRTGMLHGLDSKVFPLMNHVAAVAAVGYAFIPRLIEAALSESTLSFDRIIEGFGELVRDVESRFPSNFAVSWGRYRAALVGWSPARNCPVCVVTKSYDDGDLPAFTSVQVSEHVDPFVSMPLAPTVANHGFDATNPSASGLALVSKQRSMLWTDGVDDGSSAGKAPIYGVGGFCQQTKITCDTVQMRVLHRWPEDQVGKRISPSATNVFMSG